MQQLQPNKGLSAVGKYPVPAQGPAPQWAISTQQVDSYIPYQQQVLDGITAITIPSSSWSQQDVAHLQQLIQQRNRFVCLQLVTMVQEQYQKVLQATAGKDVASLQQAEVMHLSTLWAGRQLVAAALFYPRSRSKDGPHEPHVYVELVCCNTPGKGYGSMLMSHIERYVYDHQVVLAEALAAAAAAAAAAVASTKGTHMCLASSSNSISGSNFGSQQGSVGSCPGSPSMSGSTTSGTATSRSAEQPASCPSNEHTPRLGPLQETVSSALEGIQQQQQQDCFLGAVGTPGGLACSTPSNPVAIPTKEQQPAPSNHVQHQVCQHQQQQQPQQQELSLGAAASPHLPMSPPWVLHGIKLLSVESAQAFYLKNGYTGPDAWRELYKPMQALRPAATS